MILAKTKTNTNTSYHMPAHILVTIKKDKHASQPFTFLIDKPGPAKKETKRERYTRKWNAKLGALRSLGAWYNDEYWEARVGDTKVYRVVFK